MQKEINLKHTILFVILIFITGFTVEPKSNDFNNKTPIEESFSKHP